MKDKPINALNMIPFIDIMLVLLVIVLTTSTFIASGRIPINVPQATEQATDISDVETIEIDSAGTIYYAEQSLSLENLKEKIADLDKTPPFLLRADQSISLQQFINVADTLKQLGFTKVAVQTKGKEL